MPLLLPEPAVGWLGWRCSHLSYPPILGHLAEPEHGDSFGDRARLVRGPGCVPNTWWDHFCPTFCNRIWDPRFKAPAQIWGSYYPAPLLTCCPGLRKVPEVHRCSSPAYANGQQHWALEATRGPPPERLAWMGGVDNVGPWRWRSEWEDTDTPGSRGDWRQNVCVHLYVCRGTGVGHTQICDMQEKQYSALRLISQVC